MKYLAKIEAKFDFASYFGDPPVFRNDKELNQLQAADLYAGQVSRILRSERIIIPLSPAMRLIEPISGSASILDRKYFEGLRADLLRAAEVADKQNPGSLKFSIGGKGRSEANGTVVD